jgi:alpha-tubulin suppressor-like RCC1 family protein
MTEMTGIARGQSLRYGATEFLCLFRKTVCRMRTKPVRVVLVVIAILFSPLAVGSLRPVQAQTTSVPATQIGAGWSYSCALVGGGSVKCWGWNADGQLGDGSAAARSTPVAVSGLSGATQVSTGDSFACALLAGGTVKCWGYNGGGQLGDGTKISRSIPVAVPGLSGVTQVASGSTHACALLSTGAVKCWGNNNSGVLGDNSTRESLVPVTVVLSTGVPLGGVSSIYATNFGSCALLVAGTVKCWGSNANGDLTPTDIVGLAGVTQLAMGFFHTCAILSGGLVKCWGLNADGRLGDGTVNNSSVPVPVSDLSGATQIAASNSHSCAVVAAGAVKCWGVNLDGQLGDGSLINRTTPVSVPGLSGATQVIVGDTHTCALLTGGSVKCWGNASNGRLGDGTSSSVKRSSPVSVIGPVYVPTKVQPAQPIKIHVLPNETVIGTLTITQPIGGGYAATYPCADGWTGTSNINFVANQTIAGAFVGRADANGDLCFLTSSATHMIVDRVASGPITGSHIPIRDADTRRNAPVQPGVDLRIVTGQPNKTIVGTVTVDGPRAGGFITLYPCASGRPNSSNLNFAAAQTIANTFFVTSDADGAICAYSSATTNVIVDRVAEWAPAGFHAAIRDTDQQVVAGGIVRVQVGSPGLAIVGNVTIDRAGGDGYVTAYPCNEPLPATSNLNFVTGQTIANSFVAKSDSTGALCFLSTVSGRFIVDRVGELSLPLLPVTTRDVDTRSIAPLIA